MIVLLSYLPMLLLLDQGIPRTAAQRLLRIEGLKAPAYLSLLTTILEECEQDLNEGGCAITVSERQIRVHHLPLR